MKRNIRTTLLIAGSIVLVVAVTSPRIRALLTGAGTGRQAGGRETVLPVTAIVIKPELLSNKVLSTGTILANEEVDLRCEITGKIDRIFFSEGSTVRKGDLLVKINDSELRAQLSKLESQLKVVQEKERRRRLLFEKKSISPEDYEVTLNELNGMNAEVQLNRAKIEKTEIRAPFDGLIGLRYVSEGSYVSPDIRIASLQNVEIVKLDFSVPEKYATAVRKGQSIYFHVSGQEERYQGKILAVEPKIDPVTRNVLLRAVSPNTHGKIIPGAFAEVELVLAEISGAVMVPTQALVPDLQGQKVYVSRGGVAREVRVDIGLRTDTKVQITRGLGAGDTVLTTGLLQVVGGTPLKLTEVL